MLNEVVALYTPKIEEALIKFIDSEINYARSLGSFHEEYYSNLKEFLLRGGKRLRPLAFIMAYRGVGGVDEAASIEASLCVELLHNSSLIHDDIIDRDETRRGGPTFHAKYREWHRALGARRSSKHFGVSLGILGGGLLFNLGFKSLLYSKFSKELLDRALKLYVEAYQQLIEGVLMDIHHSLRRQVSEEDYLRMVSLKTAALFEKSILIGATLGGASEAQLKALKEYAILSAQAFQVRDDIIGLFGEEEIGKPVGSDVREGRRTVLIIKSLERAYEKDAVKLKSLLGKEELTKEEVEEVRRIVRETGALDYAHELSGRLVKMAKERLRGAKPSLTEPALTFFEELSDFFIQRSF